MKNTIKYITYTNRVLIILTTILLFTLFLGMYAEIALGGFHIISTLTISCYWKKLLNPERLKLKIYSTLVLFYFILWFVTDWYNGNNEFFGIVFGIIIIPMSLAYYLTHIIEKINKRIR